MRHSNAHRKFSMSTSHRKAMFRNLATALIDKKSIKTTYQRAKELQGIVEKLITDAKDSSLASRRRAFGYINDKAVVHSLYADVATKYISRPGGYTRVVKTDNRAGDNAEMAIIQLVE